jgi:hypothetical protein
VSIGQGKIFKIVPGAPESPPTPLSFPGGEQVPTTDEEQVPTTDEEESAPDAENEDDPVGGDENNDINGENGDNEDSLFET